MSALFFQPAFGFIPIPESPNRVAGAEKTQFCRFAFGTLLRVECRRRLTGFSLPRFAVACQKIPGNKASSDGDESGGGSGGMVRIIPAPGE